jgi:hypothetical protein
MQRALALLALTTGCGAYMTAGIDSGYKVTGGLAQPMKQTVTADARVAKAASAAGIDTSSSDVPATGKTYTLGIGWGIKQFQIGLGIQAHDVDKSTFSFSDTSSPLYATGTASLDVTWTPLRWRVFSTFVHAGPTMGAIIDRATGTYDTGKGLRFGAGVAVSLSVATMFVDLYQTELSFASGPAQGMSQISGATIGIGINR